MNIKKILVIAALVLLVSACRTEMAWNKPNATSSEFNNDKYSCMQSSQQRVSDDYVNAYGGAANNQVITNQNLFNSCMNAKGWELRAKQENGSTSPLNTIITQSNNAYKELCERDEYKPLYAKSSCNASEITLEQFADKSKATELEKTLVSKQLSEFNSIRAKQIAANRTYGGEKGLKIALLMEKLKVLKDDATLSIFDGSITWGDYNKRRKEIQNSYITEYGAIIQNK